MILHDRTHDGRGLPLYLARLWSGHLKQAILLDRIPALPEPQLRQGLFMLRRTTVTDRGSVQRISRS
jgi:hypothetical protein